MSILRLPLAHRWNLIVECQHPLATASGSAIEWFFESTGVVVYCRFVLFV